MGMLFAGVIWSLFTAFSATYWVGWDSCFTFVNALITLFFLLPGLRWLWDILN